MHPKAVNDDYTVVRSHHRSAKNLPKPRMQVFIPKPNSPKIHGKGFKGRKRERSRYISVKSRKGIRSAEG